MSKQAWFDAVGMRDTLKQAVEKAEERLIALNKDLTNANDVVDMTASNYAAERAAEGANAVEGPDGNLYTIRKARKKKGGAEPPNAYLLEPVKR